MEIAHYYHLWAAGAWGPAASEHDAALTAAGFPVRPRVGITGPPEDRYHARGWAAVHGWEVVAEADEGFEQVTLSALRSWALSGTGGAAVLYCHAKGSMTDVQGSNTAWRREMTKRLVGEWDAITMLLQRHDAVGCCWKNRCEFPQAMAEHSGAGIFAGNFWWATRSYLRELPEVGTASRDDAEAWVGLNRPDVIDMPAGSAQGHLEQIAYAMTVHPQFAATDQPFPDVPSGYGPSGPPSLPAIMVAHGSGCPAGASLRRTCSSSRASRSSRSASWPGLVSRSASAAAASHWASVSPARRSFFFTRAIMARSASFMTNRPARR